MYSIYTPSMGFGMWGSYQPQIQQGHHYGKQRNSSYRPYWLLTPLERADMQNEIQTRMEANRQIRESDAIRRKAELAQGNQEYIRKLEAERNKEFKSAKVAAENLRNVFHEGNMDKLESTYYTFINELKNIPEIKEQYCDGGDDFVDEAQMRSVAIRYYNDFNTKEIVGPDGKTRKINANIDNDMALLPEAPTQGFWNGATLGFYTKDYKGNALNLIRGEELSRKDVVINNLSSVGGSALTAGLVSAAIPTAIDMTTNFGGSAADIEKAVAFNNWKTAMGIVPKGSSIQAELEKLDLLEDTKTNAKKALDAVEAEFNDAVKSALGDNETNPLEKAGKDVKEAEEALAKAKADKVVKAEQINKEIAAAQKEIDGFKDKNCKTANNLKEKIKNLNKDLTSLDDAIKTAETNLENAKTVQTKLTELDKVVKTARKTFDDAANAAKDVDKHRKILEQVNDIDLTNNSKFAKYKEAADKIDGVAKNTKWKTSAEITKAINKGNIDKKVITSQIDEAAKHGFGYRFAKSCGKAKGKAAVIGALVGAAIGIYNWCTSD